MKLGIAFEPNLLGVISQFSQFQATLTKHISTATEKSAGAIGDAGIANMHWINPTGALEGSIGVVMNDPYNAYIGTPLIYGPRREWGFEGPDSLGRVFNDPGAFFFTFALEDSALLEEVAGYYIDAIYKTWTECIGNLPSGAAAYVGEMM